MKIAILSDTHNRTDRVDRAILAIRERRVKTVLHCGDIQNAPV
jgi:predicted phosphodiesterase